MVKAALLGPDGRQILTELGPEESLDDLRVAMLLSDGVVPLIKNSQGHVKYVKPKLGKWEPADDEGNFARRNK